MNHTVANNYNFDWSILSVCLCVCSARGICQSAANKLEFCDKIGICAQFIRINSCGNGFMYYIRMDTDSKENHAIVDSYPLYSV